MKMNKYNKELFKHVEWLHYHCVRHTDCVSCALAVNNRCNCLLETDIFKDTFLKRVIENIERIENE